MIAKDAAVDSERARWLRGQLVAEPTEGGALRSPEWIEAFTAVPRHIFVPQFYQRHSSGRPGPLVRGDDPNQLETWLAAVYSDDSLVTRHDNTDLLAPIVSSSAPWLMAVMLEALDVGDGMQVLEIGSGTGYNAALLSQRLSSNQVTTMDIGADLVEQAARRLAALGFTTHAAVGDGAMGYPPIAPYDRIFATCGVARVPATWLAQTRPGAVIVANVGFLLARLTVGDDGVGHGLFLPETAGFMRMRSPTDAPEMLFRDAVALSQMEGENVARASLPKCIDDETVTALIQLAMPEVMRFGLEKPVGASQCLVDPVTRSWARADIDGDEATIHQSGERSLWNEVEDLSALWLEAGRPRHDQLGLTVDPDGTHHLWVGKPENRIMILPGGSRRDAT